MGLASSQARLLNLTSRMHQIEYKAAKLENEKLQMANASRQAYLEYQEATEKTKIQIKSLLTNASATYVDINKYSDMTSAGFAFVVHGVKAVRNENQGTSEFATIPNGKYESDYVAIRDPQSGNDLYYLRTAVTVNDDGEYEAGTAVGITKSAMEEAATAGKVRPNETFEWKAAGLGEVTGETSIQDIVCTTVKELQEALSTKYNKTIDIENLTGADFRAALSNIMTLGDVTITQRMVENGVDHGWADPANKEIDFSRYESSIATNTSFQEVEDTTNLRKAEAKYEADMRRIDMKDRKFDYDLQALECERNAIKQEMETLKTVAKDNVERTFKLFS